MELETRKEDQIFFVKPLDKRIDASCSTFFKGVMTDYIVQGEKLIVLNLHCVEFIDSSGLGAFISILKTLSNLKGTIALCEINQNVLNLFDITRLNTILSISTSEIEAKKNVLQWVDAETAKEGHKG